MHAPASRWTARFALGQRTPRPRVAPDVQRPSPAGGPDDGGAGAEARAGIGLLPGTPGPAQRSPSTSAPGAASAAGVGARRGRPGSIDEQLSQLEFRLLAEAGEDPAAQEDVRRHLTVVTARFDNATIRQFLPVLIEREVRRRLAGG